MDRGQFDALTRLVAATTSRRIALGTLLGAVLLRREPDVAHAKRKGKGKRKNKQNRSRPCYPGTGCVPGPGRNNAGCDFSGSDVFNGLDAQGSQLRGVNFAGADLSGADLSGADLGGACLVNADLTDANLDGATLKGAIVCGTTLPDGSSDDSGCDKGTDCCPTSTGGNGGEIPEEEDEQCEICPQRACCQCQSGSCQYLEQNPNVPMNLSEICAANLCSFALANFLPIDPNFGNFCDADNKCVKIPCPIS